MASFVSLLHHCQGRATWYVLNVWLAGPQGQCACFGKEKYLIPLLEIEAWFLGCQAASLVQPTEWSTEYQGTCSQLQTAVDNLSFLTTVLKKHIFR